MTVGTSPGPRDETGQRVRGPVWWARLAVIGAATVMAALWFANTVFAPQALTRQDDVTYRVEASRSPSAANSDPGMLWFYRLQVDGRIVPVEAIADARSWRVDTSLAPAAPPGVALVGPDASIAFPARHFLLVTRNQGWTGTLTVRRDATLLKQVRVTPAVHAAVVDQSPPGTGSWGTGLGLLLALLLTFGLRPWRGGVATARWLAVLLGAIHLAFWLTMAIGTTNDTPVYVDQIATLRAGMPGYFPPGYPGFLGAMEWLTGPSFSLWVTLAQHGMLVVAGVWIYRLLARFVREPLALTGALLAAGGPAALALPQQLMSESPALFATVGTLWFAIRTQEGNRRRDMVIAGVLLGTAALLRVVPALALAPALPLVIPGFRRRPGPLLGILAIASMLVAAPIAWFAVRTGRPAFAHSSSLHLYNRVFMEQRLLDPSGVATQRLVGSLGGEDPRGVPWWEIWGRPRPDDLSDDALEATMGEAAIEAMRRAPVAFALFTPRLAFRELLAEASMWSPDWGESLGREPVVEVPSLLAGSAAGLRWRWAQERIAHEVWPWIAGFALLGLLVGFVDPQRRLILAIGAVPVLYLLGTATLEGFDARYNYPVAPLLIALAAIALDGLVHLPQAINNGSARTALRAWRHHLASALQRAGRLAPGEGLPNTLDVTHLPPEAPIAGESSP